MATDGHLKQHGLNSSDDHSPGTNDTLIGSQGDAVVEKSFSSSAIANSIVQRDASGGISVPSTPGGSDKATSKGYVDGLVAGHRAPVKLKGMITDADQSGAPPLTPSEGDAYVVNNWGGGYNNNDIIQYVSTSWVVIVANSGGAIPNGSRVIVTASSAGGIFNGHENEIAQYVTGTGWTFSSPNDGDQATVVGEGAYQENLQFIYDASVPGWVSSGSAIPHNDLAGLQGGSAAERYHMTQAEHTRMQHKKADINLAGDKPVVGDFATLTTDGDWAYGKAQTKDKLYLMVKSNVNGGLKNFAVELGVVT